MTTFSFSCSRRRRPVPVAGASSLIITLRVLFVKPLHPHPQLVHLRKITQSKLDGILHGPSSVPFQFVPGIWQQSSRFHRLRQIRSQKQSVHRMLAPLRHLRDVSQHVFRFPFSRFYVHAPDAHQQVQSREYVSRVLYQFVQFHRRPSVRLFVREKLSNEFQLERRVREQRVIILRRELLRSQLPEHCARVFQRVAKIPLAHRPFHLMRVLLDDRERIGEPSALLLVLSMMSFVSSIGIRWCR